MTKSDIDHILKTSGLKCLSNTKSNSSWLFPIGNTHIYVKKNWIYDKDHQWFIVISGRKYLADKGISIMQSMIQKIFESNKK